MDEKELLRRVREAFQIESRERLDGMGRDLTALEQCGDQCKDRQELTERIYRDAHSLKGAARAVGFQNTESVCQAMEGVLSRLKKGEQAPSVALFDLIHETLTFIEEQVACEEAGGTESRAVSMALVDRLEAVKTESAIDPEEVAAPTPVEETDKELPENSEPLVHTVEPEKIKQIVTPVEEAPEKPIISKDQPPIPSPIKRPVSSPIQSKTEAKLVTPSDAKPPTVNTTAPNPEGEEMIRVSAQKLDHLMRRSEELIALKLAGQQQVQELRRALRHFESWHNQWAEVEPIWVGLRKKVMQAYSISSDNDLSDPRWEAATEKMVEQVAELDDFYKWNRSYIRQGEQAVSRLVQSLTQDQRGLDRMVDGVLEGAKQLVMQPCSTLLDGFPRMVRQIAREQDKSVRFVVEGGEISVDRRILDEIKDALIHLLRNSLDHGLEGASERRKAGKKEVGSLRITVSRTEGDKVEFEVADDGRGLDLDRIRESARKKGVLSQGEIEQLDDAGCAKLIFHSGITSAQILTNLSGRGLGMAIVQEQVERLGGTLDFDNRPGEGLRFLIRLPVSLATFRGVLVSGAGQRLAIPTLQIKAVVQHPISDIRMVDNRPTISFNEAPLSIVTLANVLGIPPQEEREERAREVLSLVVVELSGTRIGFRVDEVIGEQELLVKGLGKQLKRVRNLSGVAILGSGTIVPVLYMPELLNSALTRIHLREESAIVQQVATEEAPPTLLVVDDSITSRMMLKNILASSGYQVLTAVDGQNGLEVLKNNRVDLIVSDVEMPLMNGFELTQAVRNHAKLSDIPLILFTSLSSQADREKGVEVGANAYLVKSEFDQGTLVDVVRRLL